MKSINTILDFADCPNLACRFLVGSVVLALLLCAGCRNKSRSGNLDLIPLDKCQIYEVKKKVSDFKENNVSTPEAAYATLNKIMASKNEDVLAQWEKYDTNKTKFSKSDIDTILNYITDEDAKAMKTADILKVYIYNDRAIVMAKLRNRCDVRFLKKIDDQWLNAGNNRFDSEDEAIAKIFR